MPEITGDGKIKKEKVIAPPTKVVVRHLPPSLTKEEFLDVVSPLPSHNWLEFSDTEKSLIGHNSTRAYLNFTDVDEIHSFRDQYDGYVFVDQKGNESQAIVEFAPFQKLSRRDQSPKRKDPRMATIQDDPDYLEFLHKLENPELVQLPGTEKMLEEIEAYERNLRENNGVPTTKTPLVEYLEQRRADALLHKLEARSLYEYVGRQGEKMRRRDERKEMKRLQRLERRKVKLEKEAVVRRNADVVDDDYYDEEDDDYEQMDDEEEEGGYSNKSGYSKSRAAPLGSKWAKRKELPSILAKRARRTERRRKEREERAQLEEQQHTRPSSSRHLSSTYDSTGKKCVTLRRSKENDEDHYPEKDTTGEDDQWEERTPKQGAYEGEKRLAGDRSDLSERTRHQSKTEQQEQVSAAEETKGKRYSVLKRKLVEKKQISTSSSPRSEVRKTDVGHDTNYTTTERSTNNKSINRRSNSRLPSSITERGNESELGTYKENASKSDSLASKFDLSASKYDESGTKFNASSSKYGESGTKADKMSTSRTEEINSLISDDSSPRSDGDLKSEKSAAKVDDCVSDLSFTNREEETLNQFIDFVMEVRNDSREEEAKDERERDKSVERITRTMKPSEGDLNETDEGGDATNPKDETTSPKSTEEGTNENTRSDPRTERKIRNKDRPAMQLYRPGQSRLASRLKQDSGGGAASTGSGSVGSGEGRSSSSSTSSPEVPVEDEKEALLEAEEPDAARTKTPGWGRESPVLSGANRIRLTKESEQPRKKIDRSSDYVSKRKPLGKAGEKKYRDNYYDEDDGKVHKNVSAKGDSNSKNRNFTKTKEYETKYLKPSPSNRGKSGDSESSTSYSKSGSNKFPKSRYDTQQHPVKSTTSRSYRGKYEREDHQPVNGRADSSKNGSVVEDHDAETETSAVGKEFKPQGKRYSRMRAADGGVRSTPFVNKGKEKEVVVISAEDHQDRDSSC